MTVILGWKYFHLNTTKFYIKGQVEKLQTSKYPLALNELFATHLDKLMSSLSIKEEWIVHKKSNCVESF